MNNSWCYTHNSHCFFAGQYAGISAFCTQVDPDSAEELAPWERELLGQTPYVDITLTLKGGDTLEFSDVNPDSVSGNGTAADVIAIEFVNQDRVVHVPNVLYWEFTHLYR